MNASGMSAGPPEPPQLPARIAITPEQWLGLMLLAGMLAAGFTRDAGLTLATIGRIAAIYFFLIAAFRLLGKRELSSLSALELITLMIIPEIASGTLNGDAPLIDALVGISVLMILVFIVSLLSARFTGFARVVEAPARLLIVNGKLCDDALRRERITPEELFAEMHRQGLARLEEVQWAILESGGHITFVPSREH